MKEQKKLIKENTVKELEPEIQRLLMVSERNVNALEPRLANTNLNRHISKRRSNLTISTRNY